MLDKLTKEETIWEHKRMWQWIAEETERRKRGVQLSEYFDKVGLLEEERPKGCCFCCEYAWDSSKRVVHCEKCPIDWNGEGGKCSDKGSLFSIWYNADYINWKGAAKTARAIAELPERKE